MDQTQPKYQFTDYLFLKVFSWHWLIIDVDHADAAVSSFNGDDSKSFALWQQMCTCVCARVWHTLLRLLLSGQLSAREKARKEGPSLLSKTRKETHLLFDGSRVLQTYQANLVNNAEVMLLASALAWKSSFYSLSSEKRGFCHFLWQQLFVNCQELFF